MSRGKKKPSPQELARRLIGKEEHEALEGVKTELLTGTDRSVALVASAMLENSLLLATRSRFVRMTDVQVHELFYAVNAPLSSFSAKITIAHALGIYGDRYKARLDTIRRIRNIFAHSVRPFTFDTDFIRKEVLRLPDIQLTGVPSGHAPISPLRRRYIANCVTSMQALNVYGWQNLDVQIPIGIPDTGSP